jgi:hypothetical protein
MLELRLNRPARMSCMSMMTGRGLRSGCFVGATISAQARTLLKY